MSRYRLDDLGWFQFEWLCQSLLKVSLGLQIEAWGNHSDWGRDAYCETPLRFGEKQSLTKGPFIFQAKFIENANAVGSSPFERLKSAVTSEMSKMASRIRKSLHPKSGSYILITNSPVSSSQRQSIKRVVTDTLQKYRVSVWGSDDISSMLDNTPNIRVAFPQILGLRDLTELLESVVDKAVRKRSSLSLSRAEELAPIFVPTKAYNTALSTLETHSFAVLTGPPEVGKTTIARTIGLAKHGEGWECIECRQPADILGLDRSDASQIFIADDAFGTTEYRPDITQAWAADLDSILRILDKNRWLIWTSRPAPLRIALERMHLQGKAEHFPHPGEVLVDAAALSRSERALILYRHAKHAGLAEAAKIIVREHAALIVDNPHFTPKRANRFIEEALPKLLAAQASSAEIKAAIIREIEEPTISMRKSFEALDADHQSVLIAMLDAGEGAVSRNDLVAAVKRASGGRSFNIEKLTDNLSSHFLHCPDEES